MRPRSERDAWLVLAQVTGVGPKTAGALVKAAGGSASRAIRLSPRQMEAVRGISTARAEQIAREIDACDPGEVLAAAAAAECEVVTLADEAYPAVLKASGDAPPALFVKGTLPAGDATMVAVVGTRGATLYGERVARKLAEDLARAGIVVVSGLASGIDTFAHEGALKGGGRTVAVIGSGVDVCFPPENAKLALDVAKSGAVVSEHPPGTPPLPGHFPRRNRIVAALSRCVVVVEAPLGSGALITAGIAKETATVLAVPGPVDRMHAGCHRLLKDGARLCEGVEDVLRQLYGEEARAVDVEPARPRRPPPPPGPALVVWRVLDPYDALDMDEIALRTGLSLDAVAEGVTLLEIDGRAVRVPGVGLRRA